MTIKNRFITAYISAIIITLFSIFLIFSVVSYSTLGQFPSIKKYYSILATNRPFSNQEKNSFTSMQKLVRSSPALLDTPLPSNTRRFVKEIENKGLQIVIRKGNQVSYHSGNLRVSSLYVHIPEFDETNLKPTGTMDNDGRFYSYIKYNFMYEDGSFGDFMILKRQTNLLEFFIKWGIWIILFIIISSMIIFWFISKRLSKTVITPLINLEKNAKYLVTQNGELTEKAFSNSSESIEAQEVKQLKESLYQMWTDLQESRKVQKKYEESRKELIANISHDLKTPITSILGYVEGLQDNIANTEEKRTQYLETIHEKSLMLNELIDELLLYSKLDLDSINLTFNTIDLVPYIRKYKEELSWNKNVRVSAHIPDKPLQAKIDIAYFDRVMQNLIQNSFKFRRPDTLLEISLILVKSSNGIKIMFRDNGKGISKEDLPYVFERLYRSDKSRSSQIKGSGLGLSIVKQIVEQHKGKVQVESDLNKGTCIIIFLPEA